MNDAKGRATFLLFVYTKEPTDVLSGKVLAVYTKFHPCVVSISNMLSFLCQVILPYAEGVANVEAVVGERGTSSDSGLSGGEVAAIVIVILVLVIIALIATVIIL